MSRGRLVCALASAVLLVGCSTTTARSPDANAGYLDPARLKQLAAAVQPPPVPGSGAAARDRALSERLRILEGTDRWWLAIVHAELRPPYAAQHFDCAIGTRMMQTPRPALSRLMTRVFADAERLTLEVAARYPRVRPIGNDTERLACQRLTPKARSATVSYPSGGAVVGAAYGEMFADLAPDRADAVRWTGREIGWSRGVCATHWPSDVAAGGALGAALYQTLSDDPGFAADIDAARAEVSAARAEGLTNPGCAAERRALAVAETLATAGAQAGRGETSAP